MSAMKAIVYERYGPPDVLELREIEKPTPGEGEVLVRVRVASVNPYDWHFLRGEPYVMRMESGLRRPKTNGLGVDLAGEVEALGDGVTRLRAGDAVFGGVAGCVWGSFGEYVCAPEAWFEKKPANLSFEQAAAVPLAGITALQGLRDWGGLEQRQDVLIIGASGGIGTLAVQIAKSMGAHVAGVCSTRNVELVRSLGAAHVIDYTREDFTETAQRYDLIFQLAGTLPASRCRRSLTPQGTLVMSSGSGGGRWLGPIGRMARGLALAPFVSQKIVAPTAQRDAADLRQLKDLLEAGTVAPVIDRTYPLSETAEAIRYVETERARGKVVVTV